MPRSENPTEPRPWTMSDPCETSVTNDASKHAGKRRSQGDCSVRGLRPSADVNMDALPDTIATPKAGQRLPCGKCGGKTRVAYGPAVTAFQAIGRNGPRLARRQPKSFERVVKASGRPQRSYSVELGSQRCGARLGLAISGIAEAGKAEQQHRPRGRLGNRAGHRRIALDVIRHRPCR
jgi:hypothetical protein